MGDVSKVGLMAANCGINQAMLNVNDNMANMRG